MNTEEYSFAITLIPEIYGDHPWRTAYLQRRLSEQLAIEGLIPLSKPWFCFDDEREHGQVTVLIRERRLVVVPWTPAPPTPTKTSRETPKWLAEHRKSPAR